MTRVNRLEIDPADEALDTLPKDILSLQKNIAFRMACVTFRLDQELRDSVLRELDITYAHFRVLQVLFEQDGQQIGDIARSIVIRQPALSRVIDQMQARKLVRRKQDKNDSRYTRVFLTASGKRCYEQTWPAASQIIVDALEVITEEETDMLRDLLIRIDTHMQSK